MEGELQLPAASRIRKSAPRAVGSCGSVGGQQPGRCGLSACPAPRRTQTGSARTRRLRAPGSSWRRYSTRLCAFA